MSSSERTIRREGVLCSTARPPGRPDVAPRARRPTYTGATMEERSVARHLGGAELWARVDGDEGGRASSRPRSIRGSSRRSQRGSCRRPGTDAAADANPPTVAFVSGWEDGEPFCATICSTDVGLEFCRTMPGGARGPSAGHRPRRPRPLPGRRSTAWVSGAARLAGNGRDPARRAAQAARRRDGRRPDASLPRDASDGRPARRRRPNGRAALEAARILRDPSPPAEWQIQQRLRGSDRRRTATAALAQMVATSEEFYELYRESQRQRRELERNQRRLDRLARQITAGKRAGTGAHRPPDPRHRSPIDGQRLPVPGCRPSAHQAASRRFGGRLPGVGLRSAGRPPSRRSGPSWPISCRRAWKSSASAHAIRSRMAALAAESGHGDDDRGRPAAGSTTGSSRRCTA